MKMYAVLYSTLYYTLYKNDVTFIGHFCQPSLFFLFQSRQNKRFAQRLKFDRSVFRQKTLYYLSFAFVILREKVINTQNKCFLFSFISFG